MAIDYKENKEVSVLNNTPSKQKIKYKTRTITPQCKIVCYQWDNKGDDATFSDSQLSKSTRLDVSSQLINCSFSKAMGRPSGSFTFTLSNSPGIGKGDWKDILKRGMWCVIYMATEGTLAINPKVGPVIGNSEKTHIRCVGFIDRVSVQSTLDAKGALDIIYEVSGRDFGVIYEDTTIWHNVFLTEGAKLKALASSRLDVVGGATIDDVLELIHNLFFYPLNIGELAAGLPSDKKSLLQVALQWLLPDKMVVDVGADSTLDNFWGALDILNFQPTKSTLSISNPTDFLTGNAWANLKGISVPELHELYTETNDDGFPELIFRPIPFAIDKSNYTTAGENICLYKDLTPLVTIPALDVINFSIGEDNHNRYNSFLLTLDTRLYSIADNIAFLKGSGFPKNIQNSIKRYGFRPMHVTAHALIKTANRSPENGDDKLVRDFNNVMEDYWRPAVFSESGTVNIIGNNEVKIGKPLIFGEDTPYLVGKRYYIEGYVDTFQVSPNGAKTWETSLYLTRGFDIVDLESRSFSDKRKDVFLRSGEFTSSEKSQ